MESVQMVFQSAKGYSGLLGETLQTMFRFVQAELWQLLTSSFPLQDKNWKLGLRSQNEFFFKNSLS
jgi:hypothetical protein